MDVSRQKRCLVYILVEMSGSPFRSSLFDTRRWVSEIEINRFKSKIMNWKYQRVFILIHSTAYLHHLIETHPVHIYSKLAIVLSFLPSHQKPPKNKQIKSSEQLIRHRPENIWGIVVKNAASSLFAYQPLDFHSFHPTRFLHETLQNAQDYCSFPQQKLEVVQDLRRSYLSPPETHPRPHRRRARLAH